MYLAFQLLIAMQLLFQDLRYAVRTLINKRAFSSIVVLTLALGIGANTAIFSFVNALLLNPLPFKDPDRLVRVMSERGNETGMLSLLEVYDLKEHTQLFEDFASIRNTQYNVTGDGPPQSLITSVNSWNLFDLLGVKPYLGDTWPASHERQRIFAIVLSHEVWKNRFGSDPNIVGQKITLDGALYEVLGVMPPGFNFPLNAQLFRRVPPGDFDSRNIRESAVIARLKPNVTVEQAQAELDRVASELEKMYPDTNTGLRLKASSFREHYIGNAGGYLWLLAGAVGFVLLIACVNVVNLMLVRATTRKKEMALRAALGAGRGRLVRQMLTESLLLTFVGGILGLILSVICVSLITKLIRLDLPQWMEITVDSRVLIFTLTISILAGLASGLAPALQASKTDLNEHLKEGGKGSGGSSAGNRARRILIITQTALALTLLVGAALMVNSFLKLQQVALGFNSSSLLTMKMDPPWTRYKELSETAPFYKRVIEEVEKLPGVEIAAFNDSLPLAGQDVRQGTNKLNIEIEGQPPDQQQRNPYINAQIVSYGYFRTMGIPLSGGRTFDERDQSHTTPAAIVNQSMAEHFWPGIDPVGRRLKLKGRDQNYRPDGDEPEPWFTVVGIVGDVRQRGVASEPGLDVYICDQQVFSPESYIAVRTKVDPMTLVEAVKQAVLKADPEQSVFDIQTMEGRVQSTIWQQRLSGTVLLLFAGLALALAAIGIYGVTSYSVSQRTRELGIRMALGASSGSILKMILSEALGLAVIGTCLGLIAALALAQLISSLLYGVSATDPFVFSGVALLLGVVALIAGLIPARRAARVDPMVALRYE